jgi:hypothetical protein
LLATLNLLTECKEEEVFRHCVLLSLLGTEGGSLQADESGECLEYEVDKEGAFVKGSSFDDDFERHASLEGVFV